MAEQELAFPNPNVLAPGTYILHVAPDQVLYFYNRRGVRGETSSYVNGLARSWFGERARAIGWASVTWLGDSSCESPGPACQLSTRSSVTVTSTQPPEYPSVKFDSRHLSSGIEPTPLTEYKRRSGLSSEFSNEVETALEVALEYASAMAVLEKVARKLKPGWKFQPISIRELVNLDAVALVDQDGQALMIMYKHNYDSIMAEPPPKDEEYA
jgi:hypothetical protein